MGMTFSRPPVANSNDLRLSRELTLIAIGWPLAGRPTQPIDASVVPYGLNLAGH